MKHATPAALDRIETLLAAVRQRPDLTEKRRGIFYRRSKSLLHFHEDPAGIFADLSVDGARLRVEVTTAEGSARLLAALDQLIA